jgi:hypothetical protein
MKKTIFGAIGPVGAFGFLLAALALACLLLAARPARLARWIAHQTEGDGTHRETRRADRNSVSKAPNRNKSVTSAL